MWPIGIARKGTTMLRERVCRRMVRTGSDAGRGMSGDQGSGGIHKRRRLKYSKSIDL
jgi:hypothetical protein